MGRARKSTQAGRVVLARGLVVGVVSWYGRDTITTRRPRDKTYEDYLAVPEGVRAELLDGELFMSPQPKGRHVRVTSVLGGRSAGAAVGALAAGDSAGDRVRDRGGGDLCDPGGDRCGGERCEGGLCRDLGAVRG